MSARRGRLAARNPERVGGYLSGSLGVAVGFVAGIGVTMISLGLGAGSDPRIGLVLLTLTAVGIAVLTTVPGAIGAGMLCWAFYSGFVLDSFGDLTLHHGAGPALLTMLLLPAAASAVAGFGVALWRKREKSSRRILEATTKVE
jgi:hypothetical protein